jgi:hypothetical protein
MYSETRSVHCGFFYLPLSGEACDILHSLARYCAHCGTRHRIPIVHHRLSFRILIYPLAQIARLDGARAEYAGMMDRE